MEEILHQLRLVVNPIIYKIYVSQVVQDFWTINSSWWFQPISKKILANVWQFVFCPSIFVGSKLRSSFEAPGGFDDFFFWGGMRFEVSYKIGVITWGPL